MNPPRTSRRRSAVWAAATAVAVAVSALAGSTPAASSADDPRATVDAAVLAAVGQGKESAFFVVLDHEADLSAARAKRSHAGKAKAVFGALRAQAARTQEPLRDYLDARKVGYEAFWITNALKVTGDEQLVDALSRRDDVRRIVKEQRYELDAGAPSLGPAAGSAATEWGVADVKADRVWSDYQVRGEGVVVATIDSGVQYDHPALVGNYRGNRGDGTFSHDYNFYDPTGQCTGGVPCDNHGHGTHTTGTVAGANGIGVAPGAQWIAAKGCEARGCSEGSLLKAGQWILAPTDRNGLNPKPELAPDIVNNSWGSPGASPFYAEMVEAWHAAGIFDTFSAGNEGDGTTCATAGSPASQADAYAVGAYDSTGRIASFSGFGPSPIDGGTKPNITAPGVGIRSSWPGGGYRLSDGTSMASPHVAGAAALLLSSAPSLIGKVDETRAFLDQGSRDVDDTHCGGTASFNNVWGEGKLDALATVDAAPHTAATVTGTLTDAASGKPLAGITVTAKAGETVRTTSTVADGSYRLNLTAGTYTLTTTGYGYEPGKEHLPLTAGEKVTRDLALAALPMHAVSGTVVDVQGKPLAGATVKFTDAPVDAVTSDAKGTFRLPAVAEGTFTLEAVPASPVLCNGTYRGRLTVDGDEQVTAAAPPRTDASGNSCAPATYAWISGATKIALSGDENAKTLALPFPVRFYGVDYTSASITTNGLVNFLEPRLGDYANTALPSAAKPNGVVAAFWDDLTIDSKASVKTATTGTAGERKFAIVWENAAFSGSTSQRISFEAVFAEATGSITLQYRSIDANTLEAGAKATVGIENQAGTDGLAYSVDQPVLKDASAVRFTPGKTS
ncbi:S8 family serine peptidase [Streptomyces sp. YC504]|uniref:S8 family serine peptidase n=1 Tax=Streptomyces mesophilus TaxID=1775132 RepID=A0A6G4XIK5_9ACTN|nr:S8 family serine peptidase [Streptomyces mesophilus]NGO77012.1 S8 family serine peptidase [Streptomyces mesophilus]